MVGSMLTSIPSCGLVPAAVSPLSAALPGPCRRSTWKKSKGEKGHPEQTKK